MSNGWLKERPAPIYDGSYWRNQRLATGLSLREAGELTGLPIIYLGELERGRKEPTLTDRAKMTEAYRDLMEEPC